MMMNALVQKGKSKLFIIIFVDLSCEQCCEISCLLSFTANFPLAGDIDDCIITPIQQTQFTPLTEAICDVVMDLTTGGQSATLETIKKFLSLRFAHMQQPSNDIMYDTLVQLQQERKIYQTSKGCYNCSLSEQHRCVNLVNLPRHVSVRCLNLNYFISIERELK